ncbi:hypothetical protein ACFQX4_22490 [Roseomonas sp. GCM10028921]
MRSLVLATIILAGCARDDFARPGTWAAVGLNDRNLETMLAEPVHGVRGVAAPDSRAVTGSAAIERLLRDQRKPLPSANQPLSGGGWAGTPGGSDAR